MPPRSTGTPNHGDDAPRLINSILCAPRYIISREFRAFGGSQVYVWGGKNHWWSEIRPDSHWQKHWRGATTQRSQLLLQTTDQEEPPDDEELPEAEGNKIHQEARKLAR